MTAALVIETSVLDTMRDVTQQFGMEPWVQGRLPRAIALMRSSTLRGRDARTAAELACHIAALCQAAAQEIGVDRAHEECDVNLQQLTTIGDTLPPGVRRRLWKLLSVEAI